MIRLPVCLLLLVSAACASHASSNPAAGPPAASASPAEAPPASAAATAAARPTLERDIAAHLRFLASDALNGRGSGSRDEWIAATYLGARLHAMGLEPMGDDGWFVQQVEVQRFTAETPPTLSVAGRTLTHGREMLVRAVVTGHLSGLLQHYQEGATIAPGSVVVLPAEAPAGAQAAVARAALVVQRETPAVRQRWASLAERPAAVTPQIVGVPPSGTPAATWVTVDAASHDALRAVEAGTTVTFDAAIAPAARSRTWNTVGRITGSDPAGAAEVVVLSAHLDHLGEREVAGEAVADTIYNGADDDASGVVAVLEIARALAGGPRPRRTTVVAFFGSEEAGGFGSRYFVNRPVVPLTDIVANLQFEMLGRPDPLVPPGTLWLTGFERSTLGPSLAAHGARLVQDPRPDQRFFERSDNIQFARRGVVAHTVSSFGLHGEYHQPSDELRHINLAHMAEAIASLIAPVRWLVDGTERPAWGEGMRP